MVNQIHYLQLNLKKLTIFMGIYLIIKLNVILMNVIKMVEMLYLYPNFKKKESLLTIKKLM